MFVFFVSFYVVWLKSENYQKDAISWNLCIFHRAIKFSYVNIKNLEWNKIRENRRKIELWWKCIEIQLRKSIPRWLQRKIELTNSYIKISFHFAILNTFLQLVPRYRFNFLRLNSSRSLTHFISFGKKI